MKVENWPPEENELLPKKNLHCSLPAHQGNQIVCGRYEVIAHARFMQGLRPNATTRHSFLTREMDDLFRNAFDVVAMDPTFRTDLNGKYVFAQRSHPLFSSIPKDEEFFSDNANPEKKVVEEIKHGIEESMAVDSAGSGAPSVSSQVARDELRITEETSGQPTPTGEGSTGRRAYYRGPKVSAYQPALSLTNILIQGAVKIRDIVMNTYSDAYSSDHHWTDYGRAPAERGRTLREWSEGNAAQRAGEQDDQDPQRRHSARLGASSSRPIPMEVEAGATTSEDMARERDIAMGVRPSLCLAYQRVLDIVGSGGLIFKKPKAEDAADTPAAAAVPYDGPPDHLLSSDVSLNSDGIRYSELGNPRGWPGIMEDFGMDQQASLAQTGFEPHLKHISSQIPYEWENQRFLWWDPVGRTPK